MAKAEKGPFGGSKTDRRVSGVAERRILPVDYLHQEFPKVVYHRETREARTVADEDDLKALGKDYEDDSPFDAQDRTVVEDAIRKGDGSDVRQAAQRVEVVNPERTELDPKAKAKAKAKGKK